MERKIFKTTVGGREMTVEIGAYCGQANGSCIVRCGDTVVMVNATMAKEPREGMDYFPLSVDYEEKMYAVGKIPGGFKKREGRASDKAILTARLIDRPIRPLFPKGMYNDVSVVATVLSVDTNIPPEVFGMIGSSVALSISDIPFAGPTGSVVVGLVDGEYVINPDSAQRAKSKLHLSLSGTRDAEIKKIVAFIDGIVAEVGKPKIDIELETIPDDINEAVRAYADKKMDYVLESFDRTERDHREDELNADVLAHFADDFNDVAKKTKFILDSLYYLKKEKVRAKILDGGVRPDGRSLTDIRPIWCEVGLLPRAHGSAVFTRGQTQAMTIATLGTISEVQKLEGLDDEYYKRYMHQYNMPGYSTGEAKPLRSPGRREIGHGALAERALEPVLPGEEEFPYAIRTVSSRTPTTTEWLCSATSRVLRTSSATWTSRSPAPRKASPPSRWTSRSRASTRRSSPRRSNRRVRAGSSSSTRCSPSSPLPARSSASGRPRSCPSPSIPTRSATSSAAAARSVRRQRQLRARQGRHDPHLQALQRESRQSHRRR